MTDGKTKHPQTESEGDIDENAPLICSDETASSSECYQSTQQPMNESASHRDFLGCIQDTSKRTKILLGALTVSIIALLLYYLPTPPGHCARRGYKTFETPVIPFNTTTIAIYLPNDASGGTIKVSQRTTNDPGTVYAHINASPGNLADSIRHVVDTDEDETRVTISLPDLDNGCVYIDAQVQIPAYTTAFFLVGSRNVEIVADAAFTMDFVNNMHNFGASIRLLEGRQ